MNRKLYAVLGIATAALIAFGYRLEIREAAVHAAGYATDWLVLSERGSNPLANKPGIYTPTAGYPRLCKTGGACFDPNSIPAAQLAGDVARARISTALEAGGSPVVGTVVTGSTRVETPSIGPGVGAQHVIPGGTTPILTEDSTATVTGKTMSGASNTFTAIPNSALSNSSIMFNCGTGLTGCATTSLGGAMSPALANTAVSAASYPSTGNIPTFTVDAQGRLTAAGSTAPITATAVTASLTGASQTLVNNNFTALTGLSGSLSTGTWSCSANIRNAVSCSSGAGYMVLELYDVTAGAAVANSERFGAFASSTGPSYITTTAINARVTVTTTSTIQVYAKAAAGATYTDRSVYSDGDGRSRLECVKEGP